MRTKMKNMITGLMHEDTFRSGEKFDSPKLEYRDMVYLYADGDLYQFMIKTITSNLVLPKNNLAIHSIISKNKPCTLF